MFEWITGSRIDIQEDAARGSVRCDLSSADSVVQIGNTVALRNNCVGLEVAVRSQVL